MPIDAFHNDAVGEGDIDILFLQSNVGYLEPVDDPWFSAHEYDDVNKWYTADQNPSPLGCVTQHQFCNDATPS